MGKHKDDKQAKKGEKKISFWQKHKKEIKYGCITIFGAIVCAFLYKNRDNITENISILESILNNMNHSDVIDQVIMESDTTERVVHDNIELTGNRFTAQDLGSRMSCNAREINKRIIDAGLAKRLSNGDLVFTEKGKALGERINKRTKWNYTFSNIEWDEAIIPLIFNEEEQTVAEEKWAKKQEFLNSMEPF